MGFVIFLIPARNRPLSVPRKKRRDKGKEPTKTYNMSKGYKGICQTNVFLFGCFWIIESIEMSGHISIITSFIMVWPYYGLLFSTLNIG